MVNEVCILNTVGFIRKSLFSAKGGYLVLLDTYTILQQNSSFPDNPSDATESFYLMSGGCDFL